MKNSLVTLLISLPLVITSCNEDDGLSSANNERKSIILTRGQKEMVNENTKFAFSLFNKVNELETKESNWIMSPLSASIALSMTANGADGNSQAQIQDALGFSGFQMDEINSYYDYLSNELAAVDKTTKFSLANSVWLHNDFKFHNSFVNTTQKMYDAEVATLDLTNQSALEKINNWSGKHTNNLIPVILEELPVNLKFCILNSLYFKGTWAGELFDESHTINGVFTSESGKQGQVKMMRKKQDNIHFSNDYFALARFAYGNGAFNMIVLLPNENCTLEESLQIFTADYWTENIKWTVRNLDISFPRFELKYETDLIEVMKSIGITDIFDEHKANFSNMSSNDIAVNLLKQSAYIKVNEKGAETAATTIVGGGETASGIMEKVEFNMNRPFAFLIKEESTGTILFMGKVTEL